MEQEEEGQSCIQIGVSGHSGISLTKQKIIISLSVTIWRWACLVWLIGLSCTKCLNFFFFFIYSIQICLSHKYIYSVNNLIELRAIDKILPGFASPFSGAKTEKINIDDIFGARGCWKANSETRESCSSGWNLHMGESYLWDSETQSGIKNRKTQWENLPLHCFKCKEWSQLLILFLLFLVVFSQNIPVFLQGSSKSGYLGEASIDFADFEAETKPLTISLPLKFANSGAVLHVTLFLSPLIHKHTHIHVRNLMVEVSQKLTLVFEF